MPSLPNPHTLIAGATALARTRVVRPSRPDRLVRVGLAAAKWGTSPAVGYAIHAARDPDGIAVVDELGSLTFAEVEDRSSALAHAFLSQGVKPGDAVAVLARNHRGIVDTVVALSKLGAKVLLLNTMFAGPQIAEVCDREGPSAIVYDEEFAELCAKALESRQGFVAWDDGGDHADPTLEALIADSLGAGVDAPDAHPRFVILTSGTTGTPKGANRQTPNALGPAAALFSKIPYRSGERIHVAAPMFHSWGFAHFMLGLGLGSTLVLERRFKPETMLATVERHRCRTLAVVPVMLQRTMQLDPEVLDRHPCRSLEVIAASGSALPGELASKVMDRFGDVLYNLYGSTEVAWATIATPKDLRAAPGTAGRPPLGTTVRLYDLDGAPVRQPGESGRIFVGNGMPFEGYTGGGTKDVIDGLMSTGDVGHFDDGGRLFVDGRDDEMIVSGGENVFPREIEDLLADHEAVEEVAVLGVDDDDYGQRLKAFVVLRDGADADEAALKAHVKSNLAGYKVPREVVFLDELPRNATGKVLKRELAEDGAAER